MTRIPVRVIANAKTTEVVGRRDGAWLIRLAAPPIEGRANKELVAFLAETLGLAPSDLDIVRGHASKTKLIDVPMPEAHIKDILTKNMPPSA